MNALTWLNGELTSTIPANDRGLCYGDGLFTTILVVNGQCCLIDKHLSRLQSGIKLLALAQIDFSQLISHLVTIADKLRHGVIKVIITRGAGARGYSSVGCDSPNVIVSTGTLPAHYPQLRSNGINVGVSTVPLGLNPVTAGLKHLNRLEQVLVRQQIDEHQWQDAIVLDCQGFIVESNMANLFWVNQGILYTPSLDFAGVNGVMRASVIEQAKLLDIEVKIDRYRLSSITQAAEIFITNSLMQIVPIVQIEDGQYEIGPVTATLSKLLVEASCD